MQTPPGPQAALHWVSVHAKVPVSRHIRDLELLWAGHDLLLFSH